jgi:acyl carrier protein
MPGVTLEDVESIAREVIGNPGISLQADGTARHVPGWDSLAHTVIMLELSERVGRELSSFETARLGNFRELIAYLNRQG